MLFLMVWDHPRSTLFPYTTLFRSGRGARALPEHLAGARARATSGANCRSNEVDHGPAQLGYFERWHQGGVSRQPRSEEHTSELQSQSNLVCRLLLEKKNNLNKNHH